MLPQKHGEQKRQHEMRREGFKLKRALALIVAVAMVLCGNIFALAEAEPDITVWDSGGEQITVEVSKSTPGDIDYGNQSTNRYKLKTASPIKEAAFTPIGQAPDNTMQFTIQNEETQTDGSRITTFRVSAKRASGYTDLEGSYQYTLTVTLENGGKLEFPCTLTVNEIPMVLIAKQGETTAWQNGEFQAGKTTELAAVIRDEAASADKQYLIQWYFEGDRDAVEWKTANTTTQYSDSKVWAGSTAAVTGLHSGIVTVGAKLYMGEKGETLKPDADKLVSSWKYADIPVRAADGDTPEDNYWKYPGNSYTYKTYESSYDDRYLTEYYGDLDDQFTLDSPSQVTDVKFSGMTDGIKFDYEKLSEMENSDGSWRTVLLFKKQIATQEPKTYKATGTIHFADGDTMPFDCTVNVEKDFTVGFIDDPDEWEFYTGQSREIAVEAYSDDELSYTYRWVIEDGTENAGFTSVKGAPNGMTVTRGPMSPAKAMVDSVHVYTYQTGSFTIACYVTAVINGESVTWAARQEGVEIQTTKAVDDVEINDVVSEIKNGGQATLVVPNDKGVSADQMDKLKAEAKEGAKVTLKPANGGDLTLTFEPSKVDASKLDGKLFTPAFTPAMPPQAENNGIKPAGGQWVQFAYSGNLPAPMTVRMKADSSYKKGEKLTLWWYENDRLVSQTTEVTWDGDYVVFTLEHFSTYAVYPQGVDPNPASNGGDPFNPSRPSGSGGSGGGSGGGGGSNGGAKTVAKSLLNGSLSGSVAASGTTTATAATVTAAEATSAATKAVAQAKAAGKATGTVRFVNAQFLPKAALDAINAASSGKGVALTVCADTVSNGVIVSRLYIDPASYRLSAELKTGVEVGSPTVEGHFAKYFSNRLKAVRFAQQGTFGTDVGVAVKLDMGAIDSSKIVLYTYDITTNAFAPLADQTHFIDANGYLHFTTAQGNYVLISEGPLD